MNPLRQETVAPTSNLSDPFSQPSPASDRGGCVIEIAGNCFERR